MHLTARQVALQFIIGTLLVFTFFSGRHVGSPTAGTKPFDFASNSILSDGFFKC